MMTERRGNDAADSACEDDDDEQDDVESACELGAGVAPTPINVLASSKRAQAAAAAATTDNLKILHFYLTFIHYFGYSINPADDSAQARRRLSIRAKMAAGCRAVSLRLRFLDPVARRSTCAGSRRGASQRLGRWVRNSKWRFLRCALKFYAISLTAFLATNHVIVLFHYIYDGEKVFTELLLELRLVITKLSALIFVISWHRNQTKVRQLIKLVKSTSFYILNEPASSQAAATSTKPPATKDRLADLEAGLMAAPSKGAVSWRIKQMNWRVAKWWLMCSFITILHFSLSEAEIRTAQHLWQWLEDYSLHQLNNQTTSISSLFIMASFDNYIYTVHVYGTRLIGASVMCIVYTFQIENILHLNEQILAALRATSAPAAAGCNPRGDLERRSRVLDRELFFVLGESDWLQVELNRAHSPPIGWLSSRVERHFVGLRTKSLQLAQNLVTILARTSAVLRRLLARDPADAAELDQRQPLADFAAVQINRVTPTALSPTHANASKLTQKLALPASLQVDGGGLELEPAALVAKQEGGDGAGEQFRADSVPNSMRRAGDNDHGDDCLSAHKPRPTPMSWSSGSVEGCNSCDDSTNQAAAPDHACPRRQLLLTAGRPPPLPPLPFYLALQERFASSFPAVAPSLGSRHFEGPLTRAQRLFAPAISLVPPPPAALWSSGRNFDALPGASKSLASPMTCCRETQKQQHQMTLGQQLELHLDAMARKYELIRTVNSRIDNCFGRMLLSQYSFLFLMSCIDVVYFSLSFNPKTKTKYIIVSGMILLWFPYFLLYKFASDIGLASKNLLTSVRRLARLALVVQLSVNSSDSNSNGGGGGGGDSSSSCSSSGHVCNSTAEKLQLLSLPTLRRYRLSTIANKLSGELAQNSSNQQQHHTTRARIFNKLDHVFKPSHLSIVGIMTMDKFFLLNFAKIVITASVMAIQFISKG